MFIAIGCRSEVFKSSTGNKAQNSVSNYTSEVVTELSKASAEVVVHKAFKCENAEKTVKPLNFRVLKTRELEKGVLVLYKAICLEEKESTEAISYVVGIKELEAKENSWVPVGYYEQKSRDNDCSSACHKPKISQALGIGLFPGLSIISAIRLKNGDSVTLLQLAGYDIPPIISSAEIQSSNGLVSRDTNMVEGMFMIVNPPSKMNCELRLKDGNEKLVWQQKLNSCNLP
ncbi:MAG: hypothetical protein ICV63_18775 [Coleofasciculus sp. Co-bin14]|nr:hypothetical protein [Coleofasciculus sp. Co-bin14]